MKKITTLLVFLIFAVFIMGSTPTVTRNSGAQQKTKDFRTVTHTYTATTSLDSVLLLNESGNPVDVEVDVDIASDVTFKVHFQSAEGTASKVDKVIEWFVSGKASPATGIGSNGDWVEIEEDSINNATSSIQTFDASSYRGMKVRALLRDTQDGTDTAVAEEVEFTYPRSGGGIF